MPKNVFCFFQVMDLFNRQIIQRKYFYGDTKLRRKRSWTDSCILSKSSATDVQEIPARGKERGREKGTDSSSRAINEHPGRGLHGTGFCVTLTHVYDTLTSHPHDQRAYPCLIIHIHSCYNTHTHLLCVCIMYIQKKNTMSLG
jgi:hypothetical protein